ncbi:hypothetical protein CTEN210_10484 [Chaetoceros tenuissimus]|uniref:Uncharacterized protein n=1 Tax=Chaetoceros tenuissimus TaxID=426638 RepID=A0AAD3CXK3_9STRA|nr:hypothetical protein CTEN210_10484 [Chaetoceros tenuissimus]
MVAKKRADDAENKQSDNTKENDELILANGLYAIYDSLESISDSLSVQIHKLSQPPLIEVKGIKSRVTELKEVLKSIKIEMAMANQMLLKTGKKTGVKRTYDTNQADKNTNIELQSFKKEAKGLDPIEVKTATAKMKMKSRERNKFGIQVEHHEITKPKLRFKGSPQNRDKFPYYEILDDKQQLELHNSVRKSWKLPVPQYDDIYYHREFLLIYDDLKTKKETGLNNLIKGLRETKLLCWSWKSFEPVYKAYITNDRDPKYLPPSDQQNVRKGRKRLLGDVDSSVVEMNSDIHNSPSEVRDPKKDARRALAKRLKKNTQIEDMEVLESLVNRITCSNYSFLSVLNDTDVVLTNLSNVRLKSESREIASKSSRTLASHCCGIILSQFRVGVWRDKPNNLNKGALQAYKLAQIILDSPDVYPIHESYIMSYDAHGYRYIKGIGAISNRSKIGKISLKHGNLHALKKSQASWSEADEGDNMFKSINVKEQEINAANGARGRKCIQISVTKDQCPSGFLPIRVPGLGAGLEMKPTWDENDYGIVMFVVGKTEDEHRLEEDPEDVSNSLRMTQFLLDEIFDPFIRDQRIGNRQSIPFTEGVVVEEKNSVKLAVDSDVNMMKLMKRPEIVDRYSTNKVVLQNHAAGYTECGSANDLQQLHKNTKREMRSSTCEDEETRLKSNAIAMMKKLKERNELNVPKWMHDTIVDCIATNNGANDRACNASTIKEGYLLSGEVSRKAGGKGINSCPDLYEIIARNKNPTITKDPNDFIRKLHLCARSYGQHGNFSEEYFDNLFEEDGTTLLFPKDFSNRSSEEKEKIFGDGQYHLMRTILPHWDHFVRNEKLRRTKVIESRNRKLLSDYNSALALFTENEKTEAMFSKPISECTPKDFANLTLSSLVPFVIVRATTDPYSSIAKEIRKRNKGKPDDFDAEADLSENPGILEWAYKNRNKPVIAIRPNPPVLLEDTCKPIPIPTLEDTPLTMNIGTSSSFNLDSDWIDKLCQYLGNCSDRQSDFKENCKEQIDELKDSTLADILKSRLGTHINSYGDQLDINDGCWQFMFENIDRMAVIMKSLGYVHDDEILKRMQPHETLFSRDFHTNHEILQEEHSAYSGAYAVFDKIRGIFIRGGSASDKFGHEAKTGREKGRVNSHIEASKERPKSRFQQMYPHKDSDFKSSQAVGTFQDLEFIPILRFNKEHISDIQNLFHWSDNVVHYLDRKNVRGSNTLEHKKHRLVCYLFETIVQLCLDANMNVSQNPGCETFCGVWNIANECDYFADLDEFRQSTSRIIDLDL